jgi:penicillin-binding protein 2
MDFLKRTFYPMIQKTMLLVLLLPLLVACNAMPNGEEGTSEGEIQQAGLTPQEVLESFMESWAVEDFEAMYSLLSPRSVEIYPLDDFRALYLNTHADIDFESVSYEIHDVLEQGNSAAITYDITLETIEFNNIPDAGRTMRLVREGNEWQIAWSPMDIINGMTANVNLVPQRTFPSRGNIYDRNGRPLANSNGSSVALIMRLSDMRGETECTELLSRIMLRPISYFTQLYIDYRAADTAFFVGEIDSEIYSRYQNDLVNLCGTDIEIPVIGPKVRQVPGRSYFGNGAAAHITGFFGYVTADMMGYWRDRGYNETDLVGSLGIEFEYQDILAGRPNQSLRLIDDSGAILRVLGSSQGSPAAPVKLTIDRDLQWVTAQAFIDAWNYAAGNWAQFAPGGAAVVLDVNTGAVLSMFSFPTYDPRIFFPDSYYYATSTEYAGAVAQIGRASISESSVPPITNRAMGDRYAPGSVFKIISALAAGDSGVWDSVREFDCQHQWFGAEYGDTSEFREDWRLTDEVDPAGEITMSQALTASCNPFFWEIGALMFQRDPNLLYNYAIHFGMGAPTGIRGLSGEVSGNIPQPQTMEFALNDVIGQGDTQVTALQMARLVAAVANGGTLYRPYIVSQVGGIDGAELIEVIEPEVAGELDVSPEALAIVREGMCNVPTDPEFGTAYDIFDNNEHGAPSYSSCGKTGTAQAGFAPNAWYVAFAPADNPVIAIAVVVPNSRHGSEVSAPIVRRIFDHYFQDTVVDFPDWWIENEYFPVEPPNGYD